MLMFICIYLQLAALSVIVCHFIITFRWEVIVISDLGDVFEKEFRFKVSAYRYYKYMKNTCTDSTVYIERKYM